MKNERRMIDLDKIKPMDFQSYEMDGLDVVRYLATLPTVDAVEVVHGQWEYDPNGCDWGIGAYRCSHCGNRNGALPCNEDAYVYSYACSRYCPYCGAKMDGE